MSDVRKRAGDRADGPRLLRELADSHKASAALQQIIDALASLPALEHFVPAALRIVAQTFESEDCAYYEHREGDLIRMRYWFFKGQVFGPEDIQAFGNDHEFAEVKALEAGFQMPDEYLGVPIRKRTRAQVVDYDKDWPADRWTEMRRRFNWYVEANVPLVVDGEADGALLIFRGLGAVFTSAEIELAERLGQLLALAMAVDRLATGARQAAASQERELATQIQLNEMAKTDRALQETTDALAAMPDLANFVPAALQIIATAFKARDCAYYEHRRGDPIRLRYWFFNGRVLSPDDMAGLGQEDAFMRSLSVDGFIVPDSYIGVPFRQRAVASVVDHTQGRPPSVFDDECNRRGWHLELNVPLVVAGEADGAMVIYRDINAPFTPREMALAERLGQPLALAMEASRLSAAAKDAAVAEERARAARERAAELSRYADVLTETVDSLVGEEDFLGFIGRLLVIASSQLQVPITEYWINDEVRWTTLVLTSRDGLVYRGSDDPKDVRARGVPIPPEMVDAKHHRDRTAHQIIDMLEDAKFRDHVEAFGMPVTEWCRERGVQQLVILPLLRNGYAYGSLCLYLPAGHALEQSQLDLAFSLAQQVSLAVRMTELAEESKQSAVSREREAAANDRAAELIRANVLLRSTLEQLSDERDLQNFPRAILKIAMEHSGARDGAIFVFDQETNTLRSVEYVGSPDSPKASSGEFSRPFPADAESVWANAIRARAPIVYDTRMEGHKLLPGAAEWHLSRGNRSVVIVPMFINMEPYGYFGMGLPQPADEISKVDLELVQALTQQASLAVQLARLAEESKQAAVAHERERDAEERAAEFANANEVLRSTLDQLSKEHDLHSFPRTILHEAMRQAGGRDGLILIYDRRSDTLNRSEYINSDTLPASVEFSRPFPASGTPAWTALVSNRSPIVFDVEKDAALLLPGLSDWHRWRGNRSIIAAAMFIDGQPYGYFGITLEERASDVSNVKKGLVHSLAQQATLAIQLTNLAEGAQQAAIMLERQQVVVQERANLAREIHDRLAQGYAAILMQQHTMRRSLLRAQQDTPGPTTLLEQLDIIERLSRENLAEARRTMDELRVDPFGPGDLAVTLKHCVGQFTREHDFAVSLHLDDDLPALRRYVETELCRIVLEALTNARRHARCGSARVLAAMADHGLRISVQDDGIGFDMGEVGPSFGLASMQERAARAGAQMKIASAPGRGTQVQVTLTP